MAKAFGMICSLLAFSGIAEAESPRIKVLFLGDNGHHKPSERAADLLVSLARSGIDTAIAPAESPRIKVAPQEARAARESRPERSDGRP